MPTVTQPCLENLVSEADRCSVDEEVRVGHPAGSCDDPPMVLQKVIGSSVERVTKDPYRPYELHSPAYDVLRDFSITGPQIGEIFNYYFELGKDPDNYDLREATCRWFVDNYGFMESFIPSGYPRTLQEDETATHEPMYYAAVFLSVLATSSVIVSSVSTYLLRKKPALKLAPVEFLAVLLIGLFMVSVASILLAVPPTDEVCFASIWMTNIGYTLELVPLVVRMAAIFRLMRAAQEMQHIEFTRNSLLSAVAFPVGLVIILLICWSALDPPRRNFEYAFTPEVNRVGEHVVAYRNFCASEFVYWYWAEVSWHFLLLISATVQAFHARNLQRMFANENQSLPIMIYSHFVFVWLRGMTYLLDESFEESKLGLVRSMVLSLDSIFTILIYFVPRFFSSGGKGCDTPKDGGEESAPYQTHSEKEFQRLQSASHFDNMFEEEQEIDGMDLDEVQGQGDDLNPQEIQSPTEDHVGGNSFDIDLDSHPGYTVDADASSQISTLQSMLSKGPELFEVDEDSHPGYAVDDDDEDDPPHAAAVTATATAAVTSKTGNAFPSVSSSSSLYAAKTRLPRTKKSFDSSDTDSHPGYVIDEEDMDFKIVAKKSNTEKKK